MRFLLFIALFFSLNLHMSAQDNKDLAKVYFQKALKSYKELDLEKTTRYLRKYKELNDGITSEKVAIFGSNFFYELGAHDKAEEYFKAFFKLNKNKSSTTYKEMLLSYTNNLDAKENPNAVSKLKVLKQEKEKKEALDKAQAIEDKQEEISRLTKSISSLEKSLSYISDKNSSQYLAMQSSLNKMKENLTALSGEIKIKDSNVNTTKAKVETTGKGKEFIIIEEPPVFPGCKGNRAELRNCLNSNIQRHFSRKFNSDLPNELGLSAGRKRVFITFKIDKNGDVVDVNARAPHPKIRDEAIKVIKLLPKMKPGTQRGKPVGVAFNIPFTLTVN